VWCSIPRSKRGGVSFFFPYSLFEQSLQIAEFLKAKQFGSHIWLNQTVSCLPQDLPFLTPSLPNYMKIISRTDSLAYLHVTATNTVSSQPKLQWNFG